MARTRGAVACLREHRAERRAAAAEISQILRQAETISA
jgi:hypothetical protein